VPHVTRHSEMTSSAKSTAWAAKPKLKRNALMQ